MNFFMRKELFVLKRSHRTSDLAVQKLFYQVLSVSKLRNIEVSYWYDRVFYQCKRKNNFRVFQIQKVVNPLNANPTKWSNILKQLLGNLPTNCLIVFHNFVGLVLKGLSWQITPIFEGLTKNLVKIFTISWKGLGFFIFHNWIKGNGCIRQ